MNNDETFTKYIFDRGKQYRPAKLPEGISQMRLGHCFDNAAVLALDREYRYVEGLTRDPTRPNRWVHHAWITDGDHAFDPTWGQITPAGFLPIMTDYIGIEMPIAEVARFMIQTKYASVFGNAWRNPTLARECVPDLPVEKISQEFFIEFV